MAIWRWLAAVVMAFGAASPALAQDIGSWTLDLGAAARVRPYHLGASHYTVDALPIVEGRIGDRLKVSFDDGVRWSTLVAGPISAGPVLEYRQAYNDRLPITGPKANGDFELGGFVGLATGLGDGEIRVRKALDGYRGWSGDVAWDVGGKVGKGFEVGLEARASWADGAYLQRQFGASVRGRKGLGPRSGDTYTAGLEVDLARHLTPRITASVQISEDHLLSHRPATALFVSRDEVIVGAGLTYRFSGSRR